MSKKGERYSPTQQIKDRDITWAEQGYIKFPGKKMVPLEINFDQGIVQVDQGKASKEYHFNSKKLYSFLHTHPHDPFEGNLKNLIDSIPTPSDKDYKMFLVDDNLKTMIIAQQNQETNEVEGYYFLRKTGKTLKYGSSPRESVADFNMKHDPDGTFKGMLKHNLAVLGMKSKIKKITRDGKRDNSAYWKSRDLDDPSYTLKSKDRIAEKYHLQQRFVPAEGFELSSGGTHFIPKGKSKTLEHELITGMFIALSASLLFFNSSITGAVVGVLKSGGSFILVSCLAVMMALVGMYKLWRRDG